MIINSSIDLNVLLENNKVLNKEYENNLLMQLLKSNLIQEKHIRERLLDCIQVFSDYFQKVVMLRYIFSDNSKFSSVTHQHLNEEYGHNTFLNQDRHYRPSVWDPILEATGSWFAWKMFTLDAEEKTVLVHFVLEASAQLFFKRAHQVMDQYQETQYFKLHFEIDEQHEEMGTALLQGLTTEKYQQLQKIQCQGWKILNTACEQIAKLTQPNFF